MVFIFGCAASIFRSFYYIPSYSMEPTLKTGDIVIVLPENSIYFWGRDKKEFIQRGQVIVFRDPKQKINLIKRVIAIPEDTVIYHSKTLLINGEEIKKEFINKTLNTDFKKLSKIEKSHELLQFKQNIESKTFDIFEDEQLINNNAEALIQDKNCILIAAGVKCDVPENQCFVLGDNRDYSLDSRHHGLINKKDIYGKAVYILINTAQFN
ncbi:MAG: signal peptidase I, partial [Neisseriaceae bacterium]|nr:signal peptidase I [Neisseriaceae bacterium]